MTSFFKPTPSVSGTPPFGNIPVHLYYQRADARARLRFGATWRVSPSDRLLNDLRGLIGSEQVELEFD